MQVSGVGGSYSPYLTQWGGAGNRSARFGELLSSATRNQAAASSATGESSQAEAKPNYAKMSPAEFGAQGTAMYKRGEIDFDTMTAMVLRSDSLARQDAEAGRTGQYDFKEVFKGYMDFIEKSGRRNDPTSGYQILQKVMSKIS